MYHPLFRLMSLKPFSKKARRQRKVWREGSWMIWNRVFLDRALRETYTGNCLAWLWYELCVFLAYVPLSSVKFLWKIPVCFRCTERNNVLLFMLEPKSENNTFSVRGGGRVAWGNSWYSERSLEGRRCAHTLLGPFLLCVLWQEGGQGKGGRYPSTCVAVLSWLQMLSVKRASCGSYGGILCGGCLYRGAHHCFSDLGYISLVSFKVHQFLPLSPLLGSSCPTGSLLGSGTLKIAPTCLYNPFHCTLGQRNLHILAMPVGNLTHW